MISVEFEGTDRYEVEEHLGTGTSGEVYRVYDRLHRSRVALKTLHRADPAAIYRFKKEFRALADVNHPNLVQLYELEFDGQRWFFTMELVEGSDFLAFCRGSDALDLEPSAPADLDRVRRAARQLAEGLVALHRAGKLHCDIKPPNVRVTPAGRVSLLDFGLVQELFPSKTELTFDAGLAGTPAYMSPEQAAGGRLTEASDWYAAGVMLYEALTGMRPFNGGFFEVLQRKQVADPPSPRERVPGLPADLVELCERLLRRDPGSRPGGTSVLRALGGDRRDSATLRSSGSGDDAPFIGRDHHLATIEESFAAARAGRAVLVLVHGSSGMGKSALVHQFVRRLHEHDEETVVLMGRCYERESVPYKALDSLVDALGRYLARLPPNEAEALLPQNVRALARLFPALRRVQAVVRAQRDVLEIPDEREQKRRARTALRELLERLAKRRPTVLYIDDLQWGDRDSADLLTELLRPPNPPPLLVIGCFRSEEKESSPLLRRLLASKLIRESTEVRELAVEELGPDDARALALHLFGEDSAELEETARAIARESGGSPYFVAELVRYAKTRSLEEGVPIRFGVDREGMTLERLILARLERLGPEATRLLELVAVAGRPIELRAALQAAELGAAAQAAITALRAASLIRIRRSWSSDAIEPYHDRIREAVAGALDRAARVRLHASLALALEASGRADPETLAVHFHGAGDYEREAHFVITAADQAHEALAFDRAARLYRVALDLSAYTRVPRRELLVRLGDALTNAGRGAEAARAYLEAVPGARSAESLELRRRAAEQQLISGHIDEGLETIRQVLASIGMKMPATPTRILLSLLWRRLQLKLRGLKFKERDPSQISKDRLIRIDTCRSVTIGLCNVYPVRGMDFATRHLLLALEAGEPYRIARGLGMEAGFSSVEGTRTHKRTAKLLDAARTLAERVNEPSAIALSHMVAGVAAYLEGDGRKALEIWERVETMLREGCTGVTWELDTLLQYKSRLLVFLGQLRTLSELLPATLKDVMERGDIYAETGLRSNIAWLMRLAADRPDQAMEEIRLARERWSQEGFHLNHYLQLVGRIEIALYRGDPEQAWDEIDTYWPEVVRSQLLRIQVTRSEALHLRCRAALAAAISADEHAERARRLRVARRALRRLARQKHPWAAPWAAIAGAGLASVEGDRRAAIDRLISAAAGFDARHMELYAAASRRRRGELVGAAEGAKFVHEADRWLAGQGVVQPERMVDVLAPGIWEENPP